MHGSSSVDFFGPGSPYLSHPLLTEERTARELDEVENLVGSVDGRAVVDIGCGFGRHAVEAARRGASVTAIDPSETMVEATLARAHAAGVAVEAVVGSLAGHPAAERWAAESMDLALCLFTTLGQRDPFAPDRDREPGNPHPDRRADPAPDLALLRATRRVLRPGGALVVELPDRDRHVAALVEHEQLGSTTATRRFDEAASLIRERFDAADGTSFHLAYRVYAPEEFHELLQSAGFTVEVAHARPLVSPPASLMTVVARAATPA